MAKAEVFFAAQKQAKKLFGDRERTCFYQGIDGETMFEKWLVTDDDGHRFVLLFCYYRDGSYEVYRLVRPQDAFSNVIRRV